MTDPISCPQREAMLDWMARSIGQDAASWRSAASLREALAADLDGQIGMMTDESFASGYSETIGIGEPEDYFARLVAHRSAAMRCGIRFYGGDRRRPFVDIVAATEEITDWAGAVDAALGAFSVFEARRVRVLRPGAAFGPAGPGVEVIPDQVIAAARCVDMAGAGSVELADAEPDEAAAFVESRYEAMIERRPELAGRVFASDRDELAACAESGRLAWWLIDGARAGLIGARREDSFGLDGQLMIEEAVDEAFAGRGTAALAQRALASWFAERDPGCVLFGTIDAENRASRRAAQRAGRREIAAWWFLRPAGAPAAPW